MEDFIFKNIGKILIVAVIFLVALLLFVLEAECKAKTKGMGFNYEWTLFGRCRIEYKQDTWIPLDQYRIID